METTTTAEPGGHLWPIVRDAMAPHLADTDRTFPEWLKYLREERGYSWVDVRGHVNDLINIAPSVQTYINWGEALGLETGRQKPTIR